MSEKIVDRVTVRRRLLVRSALIVVYILLLALLFVFGKGHTLIVDNKDVEGGSAAAIDGILVSVDGREPLELYAGDRDMVQLKGQRHRVSVEDLTGGNKIEKSFRLPLNTDMLLISIPKLVAGVEPFIEPFVLRDQPRPAGEEVGNTNAFTSPGGEAAEPAVDQAPAPPSP